MSLDALPAKRGVPAASPAQMAEVDRAASVELGIPLDVLMENAGRQVAAATRVYAGGVNGKRIVALAGTGNNGGDALAALRHLAGWGARVEAYVAATRQRLRPLAALQYDILSRLEVPLHLTTTTEQRELVQRLREADLVLDGLLGYSASGAPRGEIARLIQTAFAIVPAARIVAIDVPSGLDPDSGENTSGSPVGAIAAGMTVTLALPKTGLVREGARRYVGALVLADIGIPAKAYERLGIDARGVFAESDLVRIIP